MKTKIASAILFFFLFFPAFSAEVPSLKEVGVKADTLLQRTLLRIEYAWTNMSENVSFAWFALRDRAVLSRREAEARVRLGIVEAKEKASGMISDAQKSAGKAVDSAKEKTGDALNDAGDSIRDQYKKTKEKVGEVIFE